MKLYKLAQRAYEYWKGKSDASGNKYIDEDHIYITDGSYDNGNIRGNKRAYVGEDLIGDAYITEQDLLTPITTDIGSIKQNTTAASLISETNGSVSRVLDKMLFPILAPVYSSPSYVLSTSNDNTYSFVGNSTYTYNVSNIETAKCTVPRKVIPAGTSTIAVDVVITSMDGQSIGMSKQYSTQSGISYSSIYNTDGTYDVTVSCGCAIGTTVLVDSMDQPCDKYTKTKGTLLIDATDNDWIEHDGSSENISYVLSARTGCQPISKTTYACYPIYTDKYPYGSTNYTAEDCWKAYGEGMIITMGQQKSAYVLIPGGYHISSMKQMNHGVPGDIELKPKMILDPNTYAKQTEGGPDITGLYSTGGNGTVCETTSGQYKIKAMWYKYIFDNNNYQFCGDESEYLLILSKDN